MTSPFASGDSTDEMNVLAPVPSVRIVKRKKRQDLSHLPEKEKKQVKKVNNRIAAQNLRDRKKRYEDDLEERLSALENRNGALQKQLASLEEDNSSIKDEIRRFADIQMAKFNLHGVVAKLNEAVRMDQTSQQQMQDLLAGLKCKLPMVAQEATAVPSAPFSPGYGSAVSSEANDAAVPSDSYAFTPGSLSSLGTSPMSASPLGMLSADDIDELLPSTLQPMFDTTVTPATDPSGSVPALTAAAMGPGANMEVADEPAALSSPLPSGLPYLFLILMTAMHLRLASSNQTQSCLGNRDSLQTPSAKAVSSTPLLQTPQWRSGTCSSSPLSRRASKPPDFAELGQAAACY